MITHLSWKCRCCYKCSRRFLLEETNHQHPLKHYKYNTCASDHPLFIPSHDKYIKKKFKWTQNPAMAKLAPLLVKNLSMASPLTITTCHQCQFLNEAFAEQKINQVLILSYHQSHSKWNEMGICFCLYNIYVPCYFQVHLHFFLQEQWKKLVDFCTSDKIGRTYTCVLKML